MDRVILHCDLNSFYASVELLDHPELRDRPVAVCGDPNSRHGIILAKNEPAKRYKVQTAETIWQARRKCPELVLLPAHHWKYRDYSRRVNAVYERYTDLVEPFSIDESWLDITGSLHLFGGDAKALADEIRRVLREELGLTVSVGVSFNKIFAKMGSDYKKPDATTVISRENYQELLWPLPITSLLFVGRSAAAALEPGIDRVGWSSGGFPGGLPCDFFFRDKHQCSFRIQGVGSFRTAPVAACMDGRQRSGRCGMHGAGSGFACILYAAFSISTVFKRAL